MIVLDASAILELLLGTVGGRSVLERIAAPDVTLHVPHVVDLEILQVLRRYRAARRLSAARAALAIDDLQALGLERYPHEPILERIWQLRDSITAYDAVYIALAEALGAPLLTFDARLAAAPGHGALVELLE